MVLPGRSCGGGSERGFCDSRGRILIGRRIARWLEAEPPGAAAGEFPGGSNPNLVPEPPYLNGSLCLGALGAGSDPEGGTLGGGKVGAGGIPVGVAFTDATKGVGVSGAE